MRVSITVSSFGWPGGPERLGPALGEVAVAADEAGLDTLWIPDHLVQTDPGSTFDAEMLEAFSTLGFLAARTRRVRLGTMVAAVSYRAPAILIKSVTTLDVLSGGRAWLGIGAGYQGDEAAAMGLDLPPTPERFDRLEETLRLAVQMWSGDSSEFAGRRYHLGRPVNSPPALQTPHPPILVGGTGERRTLPLVARYADACNLFDIPDGGHTVRHKLAVLARHCDEIGRPFAAIEKTLSTWLGPDESAQAFVDRCGGLAELGIDHVVLLAAGTWTTEALSVLADAVSELG